MDLYAKEEYKKSFPEQAQIPPGRHSMLVWHLSAECAGQKEEYWCTGEEESGLD